MKVSGQYDHGRYVIKTMAFGRKIKARAFAGRKAVGDAEAASVDEVVRVMRGLLDVRDARELAARLDGVPTQSEFADAFARLEPKILDHHRHMLKAMLVAPDRTLSATELAASAGYPTFANAHDKFGKLARLVAEDLGYEPDRRADGTPIWTLTLATGPDPKKDDGFWRWTMRPEVAASVSAMPFNRPVA